MKRLTSLPRQVSSSPAPAFIRLGIRSFNPKLKAATERLGTLRTPEGEPIPPNTLAALKRDLERHQIIKRQIREIEQTRLDHLAQAPAKGPHAMVLLLARVVGIGVDGHHRPRAAERGPVFF